MRKQKVRLMLGLLLFSVISFVLVSPSINHTLSQQVLYKVESQSQAYQLADRYHLEVDGISPHGIATFQITQHTPIDEILAKGFAYNATSYVHAPPWQRTQEDPYLSQQYALEMMNTIQAWSLQEGSSQITIAIIDTGIDISHDEFANRISPLSYNTTTDQVGVSAVIDDNGHGTMVAGVIGAIKNNAKGIAGIVANSPLMIIKANETDKSSFKDNSVIEGIYYAVNNGASIINLSLGGSYENPQTKTALEFADQRGVIVIGAAGNDGSNQPMYPAAFETVISTSAVDRNRQLATYSNYGISIDIAAPGSDIVTTVRNNGYGSVSGTSFAAPQVSGVVALMKSQFPELSHHEIKQRLLLSSVDAGPVGVDSDFGYGIVNTYQALSFNFAWVHFETGLGSLIDPILAIVGEPLTLPSPPTLQDHVFLGWYRDPGFSFGFNPATDVVTTGLTLYAKYTSEYHQVRFITQGNLYNTLIVRHGESVTLPTYSLVDYHFLGWTYDLDHTQLYQQEPILQDVTLYAHLEAIIYHTLTLYVEGQVQSSLRLEEGSLLSLPSYSQVGHAFDGWYLDSSFITPYEATHVTSSIALYARFLPLPQTITLWVEGQVYTQLDVAYGQIPSLPTLTQEEMYFLGWYWQASGDNKYQAQPITSDMDLYARFETQAYQVIYLLEGETFEEWLGLDDRWTPWQPLRLGYTFDGWYLDEELTQPLESTSLTGNITLYGAYQIQTYTVTFYASDLTTILSTTNVNAGSDVIPPSAPDKAADTYYTYTFLGWSQTTLAIYQDQHVFPLYQAHYQWGAITILPGLDTIEANTNWYDGGVSALAPSMHVSVNTALDSTTPGKYTITYHIYDNGVWITSLQRIVRVVEPVVRVEITLQAGNSVYYVGDDYQEAGAITNRGTLTILNEEVDMSTIGRYRVIYQVTYNGKVYQKSRFIYVVSSLVSPSMLLEQGGIVYAF